MKSCKEIETNFLFRKEHRRLQIHAYLIYLYYRGKSFGPKSQKLRPLCGWGSMSSRTVFVWVPSTKSHVIGLVSPSRTASTRFLVLHAALYMSLHLLELAHQLKSDILLVRIYSNFHSRLLMVGAKFSQ